MGHWNHLPLSGMLPCYEAELPCRDRSWKGGARPHPPVANLQTQLALGGSRASDSTLVADGGSKVTSGFWSSQSREEGRFCGVSGEACHVHATWGTMVAWLAWFCSECHVFLAL